MERKNTFDRKLHCRDGYRFDYYNIINANQW